MSASIPLRSLTDGRIRIRPFEELDALPFLHARQESSAHVLPWIPDLSPDVPVERIIDWIRRQPAIWAEGSACYFVIADAHSDAFLGEGALAPIHRQHRFANLLYWVRTSQIGHGIAPAAVKLLAQFGFETLALQRIEIIMAVDNQASRRVAEKVGAKCEGTLRNRLFLHGRSHHAYMYSLLPSDPLAE